MNPLLCALIDFGHLMGVALAAASIAICLVANHEGNKTGAAGHAAKPSGGPPLALVLSAVILLLGTGLLKWAPATGVGWLGGKGLNTGLLHTKLVLGLILLHLLISLVRRPSRTRALVACILGATIVLLAVLHRSHPF